MKGRWLDTSFLVASLLVIGALHVFVARDSEPYFNNDETRHVMTGVFVRDALVDGGWREPHTYSTRYYLQYPALGLLVWPPLFYLFEGALMAVAGTSFVVAKIAVGMFFVVFAVYTFRLVHMVTQQPWVALLAMQLAGLTPLVFLYTRHVMLEVPTLAWVVMAIFYFERYMVDRRRGDAFLVGLAAAAAALTRFDGVVLLPYVVFRIVALRRWNELKRPAVLGAIAIAMILTGPYYLYTWRVYGQAISKAAGEGTSAESGRFDVARNLPYYPSRIPKQVGVPIAIAALIGGIARYRRGRSIGVEASLFFATYVTFTPLAELEDRHAIYWIPGLCSLAAELPELVPSRISSLVWFPLLFLTLALDPVGPNKQLHGYSHAAKNVVESPRDSNVVLFDGSLSGGFIYQMRRHDADRSITVLRGDKMIYGVLSDPAGGYREWATTSDEILAVLHRYDPDWIVLEYPHAMFRELPAPIKLRQTIRDHPDRYEHVIAMDTPLNTDHDRFKGVVLEFYRPRVRNPKRELLREIPMLNLREPVRAPATKR